MTANGEPMPTNLITRLQSGEADNAEVLPDDWSLELEAFAHANDPSLPEDVKEFIRTIWKAYCDQQAILRTKETTNEKP